MAQNNDGIWVSFGVDTSQFQRELKKADAQAEQLRKKVERPMELQVDSKNLNNIGVNVSKNISGALKGTSFAPLAGALTASTLAITATIKSAVADIGQVISNSIDMLPLIRDAETWTDKLADAQNELEEVQEIYDRMCRAMEIAMGTSQEDSAVEWAGEWEEKLEEAEYHVKTIQDIVDDIAIDMADISNSTSGIIKKNVASAAADARQITDKSESREDITGEAGSILRTRDKLKEAIKRTKEEQEALNEAVYEEGTLSEGLITRLARRLGLHESMMKSIKTALTTSEGLKSVYAGVAQEVTNIKSDVLGFAGALKEIFTEVRKGQLESRLGDLKTDNNGNILKSSVKDAQAAQKEYDRLAEKGLGLKDVFAIVGDGAKKGLSKAVAVFKMLPPALQVAGIAAAALYIKFKLIQLQVKAIKAIAKALAKIVIIGAKVFATISLLGPALKVAGEMAKKVGSTFKDALTGWFDDALSDFKSTMSKMVMSSSGVGDALSNLKGSFLVAFQPILNVAVPAIITLCNALATLMGWLARVGAMLTGTTFSALKADTKASYELAQGMDAAGSSAEDANSTMGIDELNVISDSSGGGGSGADSIIPDFSNLGDDGFTSFADSFNSLLDRLIGGLPTFGSALQAAAQGINGFFTNLYQGLTDVGVVEKVKELARGLAENLNQFIADTDWTLIGKTVGEGVNRAIDFAYEFLTTFDFAAWAKSLTDSINGFISTVDWNKVGATIGEFIKSTLEFSISFFRNIDWQAIGEAIGNFIKGIDWGGIIWDILVFGYETTKALLLVVWGLLKSLIFEPLGELFTAIGEAISTAWSAIVSWFDESVIQPVAQFFIGLWEGIKSVWTAVASWFKTNVIDPLVNFFTPIFEVIGQIFTGLWLIIQAVWIVVSQWFNDVVIQPVVSFFQELWTAVSGFFVSLWNDIVAIWTVVATWFNENVITPVVNFFQGVWTSVSGFFKKLWEDITKIWEKVSSWFNLNVITPIRTMFEAVCSAVGKFFEGLWTGIKNGVVSAINWVIDKVEAGINWVIDAFNGFLDGFNDVVQWAADVVGASWSGLELVQHISLSRIPTAANGGMFGNGQLFIAGEAGPEAVGAFGNKSGVMNTDQMADAVANGVYNAMMSAMRQGNGQSINVYLDGKQIESSVRNTAQSRGANIAVGGVLNYSYA